MEKYFPDPQSILSCGIIQCNEMLCHGLKINVSFFTDGWPAFTVEPKEVMKEANIIQPGILHITSFFGGHEINTRAILVSPMKEHTATMLIRTFHHCKILSGTGGFTFLICLHHGMIDWWVHIRIVKDVITELAEVPEIVSFIG